METIKPCTVVMRKPLGNKCKADTRQYEYCVYRGEAAEDRLRWASGNNKSSLVVRFNKSVILLGSFCARWVVVCLCTSVNIRT